MNQGRTKDWKVQSQGNVQKLEVTVMALLPVEGCTISKQLQAVATGKPQSLMVLPTVAGLTSAAVDAEHSRCCDHKVTFDGEVRRRESTLTVIRKDHEPVRDAKRNWC